MQLFRSLVFLALTTSVLSASPSCPVSSATLSNNVGRKIAIVIDSSGSNAQTDPNDLRISAAKAFNDLLTTKAEAGSGGKPDLVTVIDFDGSASVVYPLGDPAQANFDSIDSSGGTNIASGVKAAIDELTKGNDQTAKRTGVVVLTDGEDSTERKLIEELERAEQQGIRVSFGFLAPPSSTSLSGPSAKLLTAILKTGGVHSTISSSGAQQAFISLVASNGPTELDSGSGGNSGVITLVPGLATAGLVSSSGSNTFTYKAQTGEKLNFTITSADKSTTLESTLRDAKDSKDIKSASTNNRGIASIEYESTKDGDVELVVKGPSANIVYSVGLSSSFGECNSTIPKNHTNPANHTTPSGSANTTSITYSTPSPTFPAVYTGSAAILSHSAASVVLLSVLCVVFGSM